ncbi:MAG: Nramp family divalent metal transporter [Candidatus Saccharibacteria bacterium]
MASPNYEGIAYSPVETILPAPTVRSQLSLRARIKSLMKYLGPAFIVSVAYIDPGNFGTNICGGSKFNYSLIWVILWSNLMAIFLQTLSAKLGIATGRSLPQVCSEVFSRRTNWFFWVVAEIAAMATNLAEFLGGVLGLYLLFGIPMMYAALITGLATFLIASMEKYGQRWVEAIIVCLVAVISGAYVIELFLAKPDWAQVGLHTLVPSLPNGDALLIAAGMLGATVMPHVIFLHSQLVQYRNGFKTEAQRIRHYRMETIDIAVAMNIAFIVNAAMVIVSASVFFTQGLQVETIEQAHRSLTPLLGSLSSAEFGIALLASGLSSSAVGTMAGQTIMTGFVNLKIPPVIAKLVNIAPAITIIGLGINPMKALVLSQVVLSFALPAAIVPLMLITRRRDLMGVFVNKPLTNWVGWAVTAVILCLNGALLYLTLGSSL